jgi:phospholipid/cholesterol/gamma-HCH transport system substrate-binding protein
MKRLFSGLPSRILVLAVFFGIGAVVYAYLYVGVGGYVPFVTSSQYTLALKLADGDNMVTAGRVSMAGVKVGEIRDVEREGDHLRATFTVDEDYAPLHQGLHVRLGERSLVGESYLDVKDGKGPALPSGAVVPAADFQPSTQLHEVLASFDPKTRSDMSSMLRELGAGTDGTQQDVSGLLGGMGNLGRQGNTALDAIAAQSDDLKSLGQDTSTLLDALDNSQGQIADMVTSANRLTKATSAQRTSIEATMRTLPATLDSARSASDDLTTLSGSLSPVVNKLRDASPFLSDALHRLPGISKDLRGLMPPLSGTFDRAGATLHRVPKFGEDARDTIPQAREFVRDLNPMLQYLKPYGPEISAFFVNFNAIVKYTDEAGMNYIRLMPMINDHAVQTPVAYNGPFTYKNPFPKPGSQPDPGPWDGTYPHVERLPK